MEELLKDVNSLLSTIYQDAEMALCGDWDKSDEGFESQQILIDGFCEKYNIQIKHYERES